MRRFALALVLLLAGHAASIATATDISAANTSRAAMLIATADNPQKPVVSLGSTTWSMIPSAPGQPATVAVKADANIPDLKMRATMTLRKNTDSTLQATHTIDLKFSFADGAPITGFKDAGLPQMRKEDSTAAEALTSVKVKISDTYFLIALAKGDTDTARNLDLMQTRAWFDFPLLLNDDRIAKFVFQKSPEGQAMLDKAFEAWNAAVSEPPVPAGKAMEPPGSTDKPPEPPVSAETSAVVSLETAGGTFLVPVTINGQLTLKFVIDSGASDVSIPEDVVSTLVRTGTVAKSDFLDQQSYEIADGSTVASQRFMIRSLKVGDITLTNVTAMIAPAKAGPLLGQSFLHRFKSWSLDNKRKKLVLQ
jgi:clan AA aspartic protease (TIGR02281 family)